MNLPDKVFLRRGEVRDYLGVTEQEMTKLIEAETLQQVYLTDGGRAYFRRLDVLKVANGTERTTESCPQNTQIHADGKGKK